MPLVARSFNPPKYKLKTPIPKCSYTNRDSCVVDFSYKTFPRTFLIVSCIKYIKILHQKNNFMLLYKTSEHSKMQKEIKKSQILRWNLVKAPCNMTYPNVLHCLD